MSADWRVRIRSFRSSSSSSSRVSLRFTTDWTWSAHQGASPRSLESHASHCGRSPSSLMTRPS